MFRAQETHRQYFPEGDVELATLLSIKTGGCPEDCGYCPQAARYHTDVKATKLLDLDEVLEAAKAAKAAGSNRFCTELNDSLKDLIIEEVFRRNSTSLHRIIRDPTNEPLS